MFLFNFNVTINERFYYNIIRVDYIIVKKDKTPLTVA